MRGLVFAAFLVLTGCVGRPSVSVIPPPTPPADLQFCPDAAPAPKLPPPPRSVAALLGWGRAERRARMETTVALAECAERLNRLNDWIVLKIPPIKMKKAPTHDRSVPSVPRFHAATGK